MSDTHKVRCPECRGSGRSRLHSNARCEDCEGSGKVDVCDRCNELAEFCECGGCAPRCEREDCQPFEEGDE